MKFCILYLKFIFLQCCFSELKAMRTSFFLQKNLSRQVSKNYKTQNKNNYSISSFLRRTKKFETFLNMKSGKYQNENFSYGGDFAGHSATFDARTGILIRVPDYLVPESLIEWGQIPSCLETITSENLKVDDDNSILFVERSTVSIMPEVGCGVDNLDTTKKKSTLFFDDNFSSSSNSVNDENEQWSISSFHQTVYTGSRSSKDTKKKIEFETSFMHTFDQSKIDNVNNERENRRHRIRFEMIIDPCECGLKKWRNFGPVTIDSERKTSQISTNGDIAKGGGLDGRTVTRLIGAEHVNNPFPECSDTIVNTNDLIGKWQRVYFESKNTETITYLESDFENETPSSDNSVESYKVNLLFPLGIMIKYSHHVVYPSSFIAEVSKFVDNECDTRSRLGCTRTIKCINENEFEISTEQWHEKRLN